MTDWKVGDKATFREEEQELILKFVSDRCFIADSNTGEHHGFLDQIKQIQTPAEIERERVLNDIMLALAVPKTSGWHGAALRALECAYDLGYIVDPNKKVNPLSPTKYRTILGRTDTVDAELKALSDGGHIIIGADND